MFKIYDSSSETDNEEVTFEKKRGVKRGSRRGGYKKIATNSTKLRIISIAEKNSDWRAAALPNDVPIGTAYGEYRIRIPS